MDPFELLMLFRRPRRLVGIALLAGLLWMPTKTTALIMSAIDAKAARVSGELMRALGPAVDRKTEKTAPNR